MSLIPFEVEILRECAGHKKARPWGAAIGAALETLRGHGYVTRDGCVTDGGHQKLGRIDGLAKPLLVYHKALVAEGLEDEAAEVWKLGVQLVIVAGDEPGKDGE